MSRYVLFLLVISLCFSSLKAQALDEVYLDLSSEDNEVVVTEKSNEIKADKIDVTKEEKIKENINPQNIHEEMNRDLYSKKTLSNKQEKKLKKTTLGVKSDTTLGAESATQTRTLYSNYDVTEKMSVGTSYKNTSNGISGKMDQGSVSIAPEYKINKKVSIKNEYSRNLGSQTNKGELKLNVNPFEDGRMDFNAGVGHQQRDNGGASSSQVNFGTNFRF